MSVPVLNKFAFPLLAADTTKDCQISNVGEVKQITLMLPTFTNTVTGTLTIVDEDDVVLYTSTAQAMTANYVLPNLSVFVSERCRVRITLSGVPGTGGGTVQAKIFLKA